MRPLKRACVLGHVTLGVCKKCASLEYMGGSRHVCVCVCHRHKPARRLAWFGPAALKVWPFTCALDGELLRLSRGGAGEEWSRAPRNNKAQ